MRKVIYILLLAILGMGACTHLDIPPLNVIQDEDVFTNEEGITAYLARIYSEMPIEDFRYSPVSGFNNASVIQNPACNTGEAISRDLRNATTENFNGFWAYSYHLIRETNYFIETLPKYANNFDPVQVKSWIGEAYFIRGFTYFALVKRYGGVPIVDSVLEYPGRPISDYQLARSSEEEVYEHIGRDLDSAAADMKETNLLGRANKYAALALKSRVMLFAGSIAKYNSITLFDNSHDQLCGIPKDKAVGYFKASYDAAKKLEGKYSLYKKTWKAGDPEAEYQNYVNLFLDSQSPENIFVKEYQYPSSTHGYDAYNVPRQLQGGTGYSSEICPTLNFVDMFDGLPKNPNGTLKVLDAQGDYLLYNNTMDIFDTVEPRLRATVILPGDNFKNQSIEVRRGIYTGDRSNNIPKLIPEGSTEQYPTNQIVQSANTDQKPYELPDGSKMNPAGQSGIFTADKTCTLTGFYIRKYLNPDMPTSEVLLYHSDQTWIAIRYAEVLLNRAEAAYELYEAGQSGDNYRQDAFEDINKIRERAGATLLGSVNDLNNINIIRKERRKELAFENKIWWDLKRWRIIDKEQNSTIYNTLMPFYAAKAGKYFFDIRPDETNKRFTFDPRWYYEAIPGDVINKNKNLLQNPGY